jgi:phosphoserine phosphatase RsbU/P
LFQFVSSQLAQKTPGTPPASDGVTEAEDNAGNQFGDSELNAIAHYENIDTIIDHAKNFQAPNLAQDDCTLLKIRYMA